MASKDLIFDQQHKKRVESFVTSIKRLYDKATARFIALAQAAGYDGKEIFNFSDDKEVAKQANEIVKNLSLGIQHVVLRGTDSEWSKGNVSANSTVGRVLQAIGLKEGSLSQDARKIYFDNNRGALKAFQSRKLGNGDTLSKRLWDIANQHKLENELAYSIEHGTSADEIAGNIKRLLNDPNRLYRRVRDEFGEMQLSKHAKQYSPGAGVYRSSYKNALRLARTEINMAYRNAEIESYQDKDYVVGYEIHRSTHDYDCDVCDAIAGKYPKDFFWNGNHPNCYSDDSKVLTAQGWKLFKDVEFDDAILSLNPATKDVEYVDIVDKQCYPFNGKLVHFWNKSLDILVTPEHTMVYLNKTTGDVATRPADDYVSTKGPIYRSSEYAGVEAAAICVGKYPYAFDDFAEFIGYWLADGSCIGLGGISISQKDGEHARQSIIDVVTRLGYTPTLYEDSVRFYDTKLNNYLRRFGKCDEKFVPSEIMTSSRRQIKIFLDAFIKCDGYIRKPKKAFVGSNGNVCIPKSDERLYFTTSPRLAGNLSELIIKAGHRPTVKIKKPKDVVKADGSVIHGKKDCFVIQECVSVTASVFDKEYVEYSGNVYDLSLSRNHIMLIERRGFVFWGSNCRCYITPILLTEDEMRERRMAIINGEEFDSTKSENYVGDVPDNFKEWVSDNSDRIEAARERGTLPYFIRDNENYVTPYLNESKEEPETELSIADKIGQQQFREMADRDDNEALANKQDITDEETHEAYSKDWGMAGYVGTGNSFNINQRLRNEDSLRDEDQKTINALDSIISKNKLPENLLLFRFNEEGAANFFFGTEETEKMLDALSNGGSYDFTKVKGTTVQDKGFTSTSLTPSRNVFRDRPFCFEIKAQTGTNAFVTKNFGESEVVLGRDQRMIVVGGRKDKMLDLWGDLVDKIIIECVII